MKTDEMIFRLYDAGERFVVLRGRNLFDLIIDNNGRITTILNFIRMEAQRRNLILLTYSKSEGLEFDTSSLTKSQTEDVNNTLKQFQIWNTDNINCSGDDDFSSIMRGVLKLVRSETYPQFRDGNSMAFILIIHSAENNCPEMQSGFHTEKQIIAIELATKLSKSIGLRKSGYFIIFSEEREGTLASVITRDVKILHLPQPDNIEKKEFLNTCKKLYPNSKTNEELTDDIIVNITSNTPNHSLEKLFYASHKTGSIITPGNLYEKKQQDIIQISEGTLEAVDFNRIKSHKLVGRNIERPLEIAKKVADDIKTGTNTTLKNLLFCGAPSVGKTDLVFHAAYLSGIQAFILKSPKSGIVGDSERKATLMLNTIRTQHGIGLMDELEMTFPMNRNIQGGDSGVTQNLMGQLQSFLSDSSLNGKVALFATSNKPELISEAMLSRWTPIPVLMPLREDFPSILCSNMNGLNPEFEEHVSDHEIVEAAEDFYHSGSTTREFRDSIFISMAFVKGKLNKDHILFASKDKMFSGIRLSYVHSELTAIHYCPSKSLLPWWNIEKNCPEPNYPYPGHIRVILDDKLMINREKLEKYRSEIEPYANV